MEILNDYKMKTFLACAAANRPSYCKFKTNVCCFNCEYNSECTIYAKANNIKILPCTTKIFDKNELCEYAL